VCATALRYPKARSSQTIIGAGAEAPLYLLSAARTFRPRTIKPSAACVRWSSCESRQGTRSDKGLENHSVLRSLFETARRQGKNPHEFFWRCSPKPQRKLKPPSTASRSVADRARRSVVNGAPGKVASRTRAKLLPFGILYGTTPDHQILQLNPGFLVEF